MACYHPKGAYQARPGSPIFFGQGLDELPADGRRGRYIQVPCGKCLGCMSAHATDWARRCEHEAARHEVNCFVTLTYDDEHLPKSGSVRPEDHKAFMKALRKEMDAKGSKVLGSRSEKRSQSGYADWHDGIRFFMCAEYGTRKGRPHYHYLLFNCGFADWTLRDDSVRLGVSESLGKCWTRGLHAIGEMSGASANYIAQYTLAKQRQVFVHRREPFLRMSLKPGIGMQFVEEYGRDLQHGYLVTDGSKGRIPKGYVDRAKRDWPELAKRIEVAKAHNSVDRDDTPDMARLAAGEVIHARAKALGEHLREV